MWDAPGSLTRRNGDTIMKRTFARALRSYTIDSWYSSNDSMSAFISCWNDSYRCETNSSKSRLLAPWMILPLSGAGLVGVSANVTRVPFAPFFALVDFVSFECLCLNMANMDRLDVILCWSTFVRLSILSGAPHSRGSSNGDVRWKRTLCKRSSPFISGVPSLSKQFWGGSCVLLFQQAGNTNIGLFRSEGNKFTDLPMQSLWTSIETMSRFCSWQLGQS